MTRDATNGNIDDPAGLEGAVVVGGDGGKLGHVDAVYYDNATDRAEWVSVRGGLFGRRVTLVPLCRAALDGDELRIPYDGLQLRHAPHHYRGRELSAADEADLYRYYGVTHVGPLSSVDPAAATEEMTVAPDLREFHAV